MRRSCVGRQRSAGTRTILDVWKRWVGRGRRPEDDRELMLAGGDVEMVIWVHQEDRRSKPGVLILGTTGAAVESLRAALGDVVVRQWRQV